MYILCIIENKITLGELLTIIIGGLTIFFAFQQTIKQIDKSNEIFQKEQKNIWFLNVIVSPQLESIKKVYLDAIEKLNRTRSDLVRLSGTIITPHELLSKQMKEKQNIKDQVGEELELIISLVHSYDKDIASNLRTEMMELQDLIVESIDNFQETINIRSSIIERYEKFMYGLNNGLTINH